MFTSLLFILTMTKSKRKAELAADSDSQQPVKRASHSSAKLNTQLAKATRPVQWKENNIWTDHLLAYLLENVNTRLKLFSDSTQEAQEEGRLKVC